jgi:hypothetical protein
VKEAKVAGRQATSNLPPPICPNKIGSNIWYKIFIQSRAIATVENIPIHC